VAGTPIVGSGIRQLSARRSHLCPRGTHPGRGVHASRSRETVVSVCAAGILGDPASHLCGGRSRLCAGATISGSGATNLCFRCDPSWRRPPGIFASRSPIFAARSPISASGLIRADAASRCDQRHCSREIAARIFVCARSPSAGRRSAGCVAARSEYVLRRSGCGGVRSEREGRRVNVGPFDSDVAAAIPTGGPPMRMFRGPNKMCRRSTPACRRFCRWAAVRFGRGGARSG
jgi:hypothetical protein